VPALITEHFSGFPERTLRPIDVWKARFAFSRAARVLPVSVYLRNAIEAYGIRSQFSIVPNVFDPEVFFPPLEGYRANNPRRLLFVGNLDPLHVKGFPTLLDALARLEPRRAEWELDVAGRGAAADAYEQHAARLGLARRVHFHGVVGKAEVARLMRGADFFVLPSRYDNMPSVAVEALASGLPTVATAVGGIPEIVDEESGVLVRPNDAAALADALDEVLSGRRQFDRPRIASSARGRYSSPVVAERLHAIYRDAIADADGRR
jgi:glycosyltransferase involved in cell wall biosynthesis